MEKQFLKNEMIRIQNIYGVDKFNTPKDVFDCWYELVGDCRKDVFHEAVTRYIKNNVFPPNVAGVMHYYNEIVNAHDERLKKILSHYTMTRTLWKEGASNETVRAWIDYVKQFPLEEMVNASQKLADKAYGFYYDCLCDGQEIPQLKEYIALWMQKDN